jgi:anti-anti-sigma factor
MEIGEEILDGDVVKINLSGRMDLAGVNAIESDFTSMTAAPRMAVIVDMSGVPYMSSIGIRSLLIRAKSVTGRGGKYVLTGLQSDVMNVLHVSGIDKLIKICDDVTAARESVK